MPVSFDLILKGGEVLDPAQGLRSERDVGFKDGNVAAVADGLPRQEGAEVVDVAGKLVVPGLIDLHGHFNYKMMAPQGDADATCLPFGVTTAVDAGSTGWIAFPAFRSYVMEKADTRLFAFVHLSGLGTTPLAVRIPDLEDFRFARLEETVRCIEENRDLVLGVKVRLCPNGTGLKNAIPALEMARQIGDQTGCRTMVHVMESPLPLEQVFEYLKPGDIVTHIFHGDVNNVLDEEERVRPEVWKAHESGIVYDTAGAARHLSFPVCHTAMEQGLFPDVISTDGTAARPDRTIYRLPEHMSILLELGMPLEEVIRAVTCSPASVIGRPDLGSLEVGSVGDVTVLELEGGDFTFEDQLGNQLRSSWRFAPVMTVKGGRQWRRK